MPRKILINSILFLATLAVGNALMPTAAFLTDRQNPKWPQSLADTKPEVVILGNSMVGRGIDTALLTDQLRQKTMRIWSGGAATAWWYLVTKNQIVPADPRPHDLVLCFRDRALTMPAYRVLGSYGRKIDGVAHAEEPAFERLALAPAIGPIQYWLETNCRLFRARYQVKPAIEDAAKTLGARLLGYRSVHAANRWLSEAFTGVKRRSILNHEAQVKAELVLATGHGRFDEVVDRSFLPAIIDLTQANGIRLTLVRIKRRRDAEARPQPGSLPNYIAELKRYAAAHGVAFIDFTREDTIKPEHFGIGDHLNETGRRIFTRRLAAELKRVWQKNPQGS